MSLNLFVYFLLIITWSFRFHFLVVEGKPTGKECPTPSKLNNSFTPNLNSERTDSNCTSQMTEDNYSTVSAPDIAIMVGITLAIIVILKLRSAISYHCSSLRKWIMHCRDSNRDKQTAITTSINKQESKGREKTAYGKSKVELEYCSDKLGDKAKPEENNSMNLSQA
jgi:hypothetical protein